MNDSNSKVIAHKRRNKRLLLLFIMFGITTIMCIATTYAWFVGMGEVKVNNFTVNLVTDPSLEISLDGYTWSENITITENTIKAHSDGGSAYSSNTNSWVGEHGLVPVSSSGDNTNGKLDIYSKSSITTTNGGYRLIADKLDNSSEEKDYYVAFDIFVKNKTGDVYNPDYNLLDDENIYLTSDSNVTTSATGTNNYGIQNSVRVAFVQIGRISIDNLVANTTPDIICENNSPTDDTTKLCNNTNNIYRTVIWEPNELNHDSRLVTYYNLICKGKEKVNGTIVYNNNSCYPLNYYNRTNTIKQNITSSDNVDIYDGYNNYNYTVQTYSNTSERELQATKTYTNAMKDTEGDYTFMKLHPHSVTKIRVYVYLEGQDVDNYDLITNDQNIIVNFGLTKERSITSIIRDDESGNDTYINGRYRGIIGDVNGDGLVTEDDATLLGDYVAVPELYNIVSSYVGDTNCDYKIDSDDTIEITKAVNNGTTITCPNKSEYYSQELMMGDLNSDGKLSSSDALAVTRYAGNLDPLTETQKYLGDVNCDGILTEDDGYIILRVGSGLLPNSAICAP